MQYEVDTMIRGRKLGTCVNTKIYELLPEILLERPMNQRDIIRSYKNITGQGIGYGTVKKALSSYISKEKIKEIISNPNPKKRRIIAFYLLK
jgi:hypothetical protein